MPTKSFTSEFVYYSKRPLFFQARNFSRVALISCYLFAVRKRRTKRQNPTTFVWLFGPPRRQAKSGFFLPKLLLIAVSSPPLPTPPPPAPEQGRGERFCLRGARCTPAIAFPPHSRLYGGAPAARPRPCPHPAAETSRPPRAGPPTPPPSLPGGCSLAIVSALPPPRLRGAERSGVEGGGGRCAGLRQNNGRGWGVRGAAAAALRLRGQGPLLGPAAALRTAPLRCGAARTIIGSWFNHHQSRLAQTHQLEGLAL